MTMLRPRFFLILLLIFIMFTFIIAVPSIIFAQEEEADNEEEAAEPEPEPETLDFDISYGEVTAFGDKGTLFEFQTSVTFEGEEEKYFEISEELPQGWTVVINPGTQAINIPIVRLRPKAPETLKVKCTPLVDQEPGEYVFKIILRSTVDGDELYRPQGRPLRLTKISLTLDSCPLQTTVFGQGLRNRLSYPPA